MRVISVVAFVDWTAQIYNAGAASMASPTRRANATLASVCEAITHCLTRLDASAHFKVKLRLYHGWHRGITPTENRRAMRDIEASPGYELPRFDPRVVFQIPIEYGDILIDALPHRLRPKVPRIHLPDTCRADMESPGTDREKMVDTALACDLLSHARMDPRDWRIVIGEDDDLVPPTFVSEAWSKHKGGRTVLLRRRTGSKHLDLTGILCEIPPRR